MTTEEKLKHIREVCLSSATSNADAEIASYEKNLKLVYANHCKEVVRTNDLKVRIERERLLRDRNKALSHEQLSLRHEYTARCAEYLESLEEEVLSLLSEYRKTPAYEDLLTEEIQEALAIAEGEELIISLSLEDAALKSSLEKRTGTSLLVNPSSFLGGIRAVIPDRSLLINNALVDHLRDILDHFHFKGDTEND